MGKAAEQFGLGVAGQVVGAGLGLALENHNDKRQLGMERKLQRMQMEGSKEMTDYNYAKQLQMWKDTNYKAQMEQLKMAGLNPGLIYGMSGGGATTTGTGAGAMSPTGRAPQGGKEVIEMQGMALQRQMMAAQVELTKAQTEKTKAETTNVPLQGQNIQASTANLTQGVEESKAKTALTNIQTSIAELEKQFQSETLQNRESLVNITLSKLIEETKILENDREISDATKVAKIKTITAQLNNIIANTNLQIVQRGKTEAETAEVNQKIENLKQQYNINKIDAEMAEDGFNPNSGRIIKILHNFLRAIGSIFGR